MKLRTILLLAVIVIVGAILAWVLGTTSDEAPTGPAAGPKAPKPLAVLARVIAPQPFTDVITLPGSILANEAVEVRAEIAGRIVRMAFSEGQRVKRGQLLVKLNDTDLQARLQQTLSQVELDSESVHRLERIRQVDGVSIEELQRAKALLAMHRAEADVIRAQIAKTAILAPFDGVVGLRNVSEGAVVTPETVITLLKDDAQLKLECAVPEKYATSINSSTTMTFNVRGSKDARSYSAQVYATDPELDPGSRTLRVRAHIANPQGLLPGMFADVRLAMAEVPDALLVPTEAVVVDINGPKVFVKNGTSAREVRITSGTRTRSNIRVVEGLQPGDTVLTTGMLMMKDAMPVSVTLEAPTAGGLPQ